MKIKIKVDFSKLKKDIRKIPSFLAKQAFWLFLFDAFLVFILGFFIFRQYILLSQKNEVKITEKPFKLREDLLNFVQEKLREKEERAAKIENKTYPDLFRVEELTE